MSHNFDLGALKRMAEAELNGREYFISTVLGRVSDAAAQYPYDGALNTARGLLERYATKSGALATMSQKEFQELYDHVGSAGSREIFRETLGDLLLDAAPKATASYNEAHIASIRNSDTSLDLVDANLMDSLAGLFDGPTKTTRGSFIDNGRKSVELELTGLGFTTASVEVAARNDQFVIYAADMDSSAGRITTLIPAEIQMGTVLMPSVFIASAGYVDLNKANLEAYAGERILEPKRVLDILTASLGRKESLERHASNDDFAIAMDVPSLYRIANEEAGAFMVDTSGPTVETPAALMHFTENMARNALSEAGLSVSPSAVMAAKGMLAGELRSMGIPFSKIAVISEFDGGIMLSAIINGTGGIKTIEVPVELSREQPLLPSVFTSGVLAQPFDRDNLVAFAMNDEGRFNTIISDKHSMGFKDLHKLTLKSAAYGNFVEVEEALAVIAEQYGDQFHKIAFDDLMGLLNVGFGVEEKPMNAMDKYMANALAMSRDKESNIKMSSNMMYLLPED